VRTVSPISSVNEDSEGEKLNVFRDLLTQNLGGNGSQISTGGVNVELAPIVRE